ncbi:MAG: sterol desaturase family protein [Actinobacteria bacterium]|nr:sterol desaturase family protein [Actinomycetota bacterium]
MADALTDTTVEDAPGTTDGRRRRSISLGEAFADFTTWTSPRLIAPLFVVALLARLVVGDFSRVDLFLALGMIVGQPFVEWTAHIVLLHMKPLRIGRFTFDPLFARKHREHHADPRDMRLTFLPTTVILQLGAVAILSALLLFPRLGLGLTFLTTISGIGLVYEWTHYLVHSDYRPKRWLYRTLWRNHRLHHYKNENYWFSFTGTYPDALFRTAPDPTTVETSPTVRDILGTGQPA